MTLQVNMESTDLANLPSHPELSSNPRMPQPLASPKPRKRLPVHLLLLTIYLVALAASTIFRLTQPEPALTLAANEKTIELPEMANDQPTGRQIQLAYREWAPPAMPDAPVVILLHGSPGGSNNFRRLAPWLSGDCRESGNIAGGFDSGPVTCPDPLPARGYRVIAPDLPGFGNSTRDIADYSFRAHAFYLRDLMAGLGIAQAHIVGYSMGGGPAYNLYDIEPERIRSITLLSSLGVQEFELTGDYWLNHAIHGLQLGFFWTLNNLTPHFGALSRIDGVPFSRNFYESDQRPLREFMQRYDRPSLIIQGEADGQVPPEAAREHARIMPHSELHMTAEGHGMVFRSQALLAGILLPFFDKIEAGSGVTRAQADPARIAAAAEPLKPVRMIGIATFSFVALLTVIALFNGDIACIAAGVMIAAGRVEPAPALIACAVPMFVTMLMIFGRGWRRHGAGLAKAPLRLSWVNTALAVRYSAAWAVAPTLRTAFAALATPGSRLAAVYGMGASRRGFWRFAGYVLLSTMVFTAALVALAGVIGRPFAQAVSTNELAPGLLAAIVVIYGAMRIAAVVAARE
jgi:pimeloyl-ACP methyl ester carboxylesterase/membrane protein DedA with SNARE-associated domain